MRESMLKGWWMVLLIAFPGCGVFAARTVEYYDNGVVAACHPASWTVVQSTDKSMDVEGITLQRTGAAVSFMTLPAFEQYRLSGFQLAQHVARDLGVEGTIRERARTAVFAGAEASRIVLGPATTKDGLADLVIVNALLRGDRLYVGIGVVTRPDVETSVRSELTSILESGRFNRVPQLSNYRSGREDCAGDNDPRIEGIWINTRDGNYTSEHSFDDGDYTETVSGVSGRRRGSYSAKGGILTITRSNGKAVSCRYTINREQMVLRNCDADFPTVFRRK